MYKVGNAFKYAKKMINENNFHINLSYALHREIGSHPNDN
ncbi:hypothetical protein C8D94_102530 [Marinirhabdus gelatinilytica]|uniref:Uncharacterized protein n=1 Tax=Marinirhabdus gelatinilytica TaxID=1703343 RepID=A0A370QG52_9FLAO|nr:hypothetical protein C8D94_102530 [Marinirhabdus gelatinilytica]